MQIVTSQNASIWFYFRGEELSWHSWPFVPRIGESVALPSYADPSVTIIYEIEGVVWGMRDPKRIGGQSLEVRVFVTRPKKEMDKLDRAAGAT